MTAFLRVSKASGILFFLIFTATFAGIAFFSEANAVAETRDYDDESNRYDQAIHQAAGLPLLQSLLVSINGKVTVEKYFHLKGRFHWANIKSASKSVLSSLVGIAIDRGYLASVKQAIESFFPEILNTAGNADKRRITIEDLLTMRSGLESTSRRKYGRWVRSGDWVKHVLSRPMVDVPGGRMIYSTGNSHLLSAILTKAARMSTHEFADRYLAAPLGIKIRAWRRDPQGIYMGGNEMHLTPRDMLKFGELYLNKGKTNLKQVVSEEWVHESFIPRAYSPRQGNLYGYGWWLRTFGGHQAYYAWGHGGQFIFIVPALKMVVVTTSSPSSRQNRRAHRQAVFDVVEQHLVPVALARISHKLVPSQ